MALCKIDCLVRRNPISYLNEKYGYVMRSMSTEKNKSGILHNSVLWIDFVLNILFIKHIFGDLQKFTRL
jgi:hypothetical protein